MTEEKKGYVIFPSSPDSFTLPCYCISHLSLPSLSLSLFSLSSDFPSSFPSSPSTATVSFCHSRLSLGSTALPENDDAVSCNFIFFSRLAPLLETASRVPVPCLPSNPRAPSSKRINISCRSSQPVSPNVPASSAHHQTVYRSVSSPEPVISAVQVDLSSGLTPLTCDWV